MTTGHISLTSRVLESVLGDSILDHVKKYKLITESQHGFSKSRSFLTNLSEYLEFVSHIDRGYPIDVACERASSHRR